MDHMSDLLDAVEAAQENVQRLADPTELRYATEQVEEFARSCGARSVVAASPAAERLVGALLASSVELVGLLANCTTATDPVLIVDVNLASGTSVAQAARHARRAGARQVVAVVLHQITAATADANDCGVDTLNVLRSQPTVRPVGPTDSGLY
jgi:hypothetical protein